MKSIFNLVLFLSVIGILIVICNNIKDVKEPFQKKIVVKQEKETKKANIVIKKYPASNPTIVFDYEKTTYETVPENKNKIKIADKFQKDLKFGATIIPKYEPPKGSEKKKFYDKEFSDQTLLFNSKLYEKKIHNDRVVEKEAENQLPKKISDIFDDSITDFKTLFPKKNGVQSDLIMSNGAFDLESFNPDYIHYEDEKPENGGQIPNLYGTVYGNDPMLETGCAKF